MNEAEKLRAAINTIESRVVEFLLARIFGRKFYCNDRTYAEYKGKTYLLN